MIIRRPRPPGRCARTFVVVVMALALPCPAGAVMDVTDRGPMLDAGAFALRITNIGVLGNAFYNQGLSFDPSFEYPRGSGHECLEHAELWVGGRLPDGSVHVSGGPMKEWRPTLDSLAHVYKANAGDRGMRWHVDDDGDGKVDEEELNGRDDDGDGKIDEDCAMPSQQMLAAEYTDDQPEAINYAYPNGERHVAMGLSVRQKAYAWSEPGYDQVAGIEFEITNHSTSVIRDVRLGVYANLDSRDRSDEAGHLNDRFTAVPYSLDIPEGTSVIRGIYIKSCVTHLEGQVPVVFDGTAGSGLPCSGIMGLSHTTDPLGYITNFAFPGTQAAFAAARAPRRDTTFQYHVFAQDLAPGSGGEPLIDSDRYAAMAGQYREAPVDAKHDYAVLLSCGPFAHLDPGQTVTFAVALIATDKLSDIAGIAQDARLLYRGTKYNFQPDGKLGTFNVGETGINGHEICYEPPAGITFDYDPHCPQKFYDHAYDSPAVLQDPKLWITAAQVTYRPGVCVWSDFDCDACTGLDGTDFVHHWELPTVLPPEPRTRVTAGDHEALIEWDDTPEPLIQAHIVGTSGLQFGGYKLYRLDDWHRESLLPSPTQWQLIAAFRSDAFARGTPLDSVTNASLEPDSTIAGLPRHPIGRYRFTDTRLRDGFDYEYVVTTLLHGSSVDPVEYESPFLTTFDARITARAESRPDAGHVWVVPNPYRAGAQWERTPVPGDIFTRHVDFFGLPKARCSIKIYTVAGDLVATVEHDGSGGNGEASWNLISRNGQDIESGIYLFSVDSPLGHSVGKFVIIR